MNDGNALWNQYCSFFDKPFSQQVEVSENNKELFFESWRRTRAAADISKEGFSKFDDIPLTTYSDYPVLHEFREQIEALEKTETVSEGEELFDYYARLTNKAANQMNLQMPAEVAFSMKTSGSGGPSKWFVYDTTYYDKAFQTGGQALVMACSRKWGTTDIRLKDTLLNITAPPPYGSAVGTKTFGEILELSPPNLVVDRIKDMRKKIGLMYKTVEDGTKIDFLFGPASMLSLLAKYFTEQELLYQNLYRSMSPGIAKIVLYIKYLKAKGNGRPYQKARDILPIKGLISTAWDGTIYFDHLREQYEVEPFNLYAATDTHVPLMGRPHRKSDLFPNVEIVYLEFADQSGKVHRVDQLEKDGLYELVVTTFGGVAARYKMGDTFRVIDMEDDKLPVLRYESRTAGMLDIRNYFNVTEAMIRDVLTMTKLSFSDNWTVSHSINPSDKVYILMEKEKDISEAEATNRVFSVFQEVNPYFKNYVQDFGIKHPTEILMVQYLPQGAFMRYTMKKAKEGVPMGQIKPPKIIPPEKEDLANMLRTI